MAGKRKWEEQPQSNAKTRAGHCLFFNKPTHLTIWPFLLWRKITFFPWLLLWLFKNSLQFCLESKSLINIYSRMQILTKKILPGKKCCHYYHIFGFSLTIIVLMFIWWWKKKTQQFSKYKSNHGNPRGCLGRLLHRSSILLFVFKRTWGSRLLSCCPVVTSSGPDSDCTKPHPATPGEDGSQTLQFLAIKRLLNQTKKISLFCFPAGIMLVRAFLAGQKPTQQTPTLSPRTDSCYCFYFAPLLSCSKGWLRCRVWGVSHPSASQYNASWTLLLCPKATSTSKIGYISK